MVIDIFCNYFDSFLDVSELICNVNGDVIQLFVVVEFKICIKSLVDFMLYLLCCIILLLYLVICHIGVGICELMCLEWGSWFMCSFFIFS